MKNHRGCSLYKDFLSIHLKKNHHSSFWNLVFPPKRRRICSQFIWYCATPIRCNWKWQWDAFYLLSLPSLSKSSCPKSPNNVILSVDFLSHWQSLHMVFRTRLSRLQGPQCFIKIGIMQQSNQNTCCWNPNTVPGEELFVETHGARGAIELASKNLQLKLEFFIQRRRKQKSQKW